MGISLGIDIRSFPCLRPNERPQNTLPTHFLPIFDLIGRPPTVDPVCTPEYIPGARAYAFGTVPVAAPASFDTLRCLNNLKLALRILITRSMFAEERTSDLLL